MSDERLNTLEARLGNIERLLTRSEGLSAAPAAQPERKWRVMKNGMEMDPTKENLMLLEGTPEALAQVRKLLSSRDAWATAMHGVAMIKW